MSLAVAISAAVVAGVVPPYGADKAEAACKPLATASQTLAGGTYYYALTLNRCAAKTFSDKLGTTSGKAGIASWLIGLVPGRTAKAIGLTAGAISGAQFLTQGKLKSCSKNFTSAVKVTFVKGQFIGCKEARRGAGGSW